jgi:hypothetical protein
MPFVCLSLSRHVFKKHCVQVGLHVCIKDIRNQGIAAHSQRFFLVAKSSCCICARTNILISKFVWKSLYTRLFDVGMKLFRQFMGRFQPVFLVFLNVSHLSGILAEISGGKRLYFDFFSFILPILTRFIFSQLRVYSEIMIVFSHATAIMRYVTH